MKLQKKQITAAVDDFKFSVSEAKKFINNSILELESHGLIVECTSECVFIQDDEDTKLIWLTYRELSSFLNKQLNFGWTMGEILDNPFEAFYLAYPEFRYIYYEDLGPYKYEKRKQELIDTYHLTKFSVDDSYLTEYDD